MNKFLLLLTAPAVFAQSAAEWPIAHNIGHTGFSPTTVLKPPLKVKWTTTVAGLVSGESGNGPVVAEGKVLIQGHQQDLVCLDSETGALVWRKSIASPEYPYKWHFYPMIAQGKAYAVFSVRGDPAANGIRCFDLNTGNLLWKKDAGIISTFRMKDSPQCSQGKVFLHSVRDVNQSTASQNNFNFQSQVQAWDALTGDTLWAYTVWDNIPNGLTNNPGEVNPSLCVSGDTVFASCGAAGTGGRTVALSLTGGLFWEATGFHVDNYTGNIQYTGDKLLVLSAYSGANAITALNPRNGNLLYYAMGYLSSYSKISALMNGRGWNRGYGGAPISFSLATGAGSVACKLIPGDAYNSGCSAPRAANGYIYSGFGGPVGASDIPKLYAWDEQGNPAWWMPTTPEAVAAGIGGHVCQDVAIAYDKLYWLTNSSGQVFCFENDTRTVASLKAVCLPETLEQYWFGQLRAQVTFTDGSKETTVVACQFTNLDSSRASLRVEGAVYAKNPGTALVRVERYGIADTARIAVVPSKSITETPVYVKRINFQAEWKPFKYGWLADNGAAYSTVMGFGWKKPADVQVARSDRGGNALLKSFVLTSAATPYQIDAPDGDYIIRLAMGDNAWGGSTECFTAFGSDTLVAIRRTGNETKTDTLRVTGGAGIALTVKGFLNYIVLVSLNGADNFCSLVDDYYGCPSVGAEAPAAASGLSIFSVSPNPFSRSLNFTVENGAASVGIFDIHGVRVDQFPPGQGRYTWNALTRPGGVYLVVAKTAQGKRLTRKVTLLR